MSSQVWRNDEVSVDDVDIIYGGIDVVMYAAVVRHVVVVGNCVR